MTKEPTYTSKTGKDINYTFMLSQISHEINNPLTLIYSTVQLLSYRHPELNKDELWSQLLSDIDYLKQLTVSLTSYNQCSHLTIESSDITLLLTDIEAAWLPYAQQTGKQLIFKYDDQLPAIECDSLKIKQCLINLIKNSFEATNADDTIEITASAKSDMLITVSDSGKGLEAKQLQHIFEPFASYKSGGSGLGLAITEKIIKAHHGSIQVTSKFGSGTRFMIRLPLYQPK